MDSDWDCRLGSRVQKADELGVKEAVSLGYTDDRSHVIKLIFGSSLILAYINF